MKSLIVSLSFLFIYIVSFPYAGTSPHIYAGEVAIEQQVIKKAQTKSLDLNKKPLGHERFSETDEDKEVIRVVNVEATAYTANCEGCSGTTYTGINLHANPKKKVIAVDPNVIPLGSKVRVPGYGVAVAGDIGGAIEGKRIDIFMDQHSQAIKFGRQNIEVEILEP
ncbi:3D domain-containing protein [Halobacillus shinanisalinarum]|uniref:3D domain-containing protein n=1 Tax=Halobacillus shinanisalinarum TaxID=2932258 RepID=UPI0037C064C5